MKKVLPVVLGVVVLFIAYKNFVPGNVSADNLRGQFKIFMQLNPQTDAPKVRNVLKNVESILKDTNRSESERLHAKFGYLYMGITVRFVYKGECAPGHVIESMKDGYEVARQLERYTKDFQQYARRGNKIDNIEEKIKVMEQWIEKQAQDLAEE